MNNDLISRSALRGVIETYRPIKCFTDKDIGKNRMVDYCLAEIDNAPTVSPDQGEWKVNDKIYCSECGASICDFVPNPTDAIVFILENKFCFNCGAKMQKDDAE